ncbi:MAG: hypothetical protein V4819_19335 [Verrucomicrobiota bacterium]
MTAQAAAHRQHALELIQQAQALLSEAAQVACPLVGWVDEWTAIGDAYDSTKALWHRCNDAAQPSRLDSEPRTAD